MQVELPDGHRWKTRGRARGAIFKYLKIFHNCKRLHRSLRMRTPFEFEKMHTYPSGVA